MLLRTPQCTGQPPAKGAWSLMVVERRLENPGPARATDFPGYEAALCHLIQRMAAGCRCFKCGEEG